MQRRQLVKRSAWIFAPGLDLVPTYMYKMMILIMMMMMLIMIMMMLVMIIVRGATIKVHVKHKNNRENNANFFTVNSCALR